MSKSREHGYSILNIAFELQLKVPYIYCGDIEEFCRGRRMQ